MRKIGWLVLVIALRGVLPTMAQTDDSNSGEALIAKETQLISEVDAFGIEQQVLIGRILNDGDVPYIVDEVIAEVLDEDGEIIGEGYGFAVDQCGVALFDVPLQPTRHQDFVLTLDLYDVDARVDDWSLEIIARDMPEALQASMTLPEQIVAVTDAEVVRVEWLDETIFRYAVGCDGQLVTRHDWYTYNIADAGITALDEYPNATFITDAFIAQSGVNIRTQGQTPDETLIETSYLTYPTQSPRVIWQNDIHDILTSERDGSFKRLVQSRLSIYSLQGFIFSPAGNFVAYYFGAYGEPVRWFTASMSGTPISGALDNNPLSNTVPGLTNDGQRVIISGDFDEGTGYYLQSAGLASRELLFEVDDLTGNNYPAPAYRLVDNNTRYIYIIRPVDDEVVLECFHLEASEKFTLSTLPITLNDDERAWSWLSPDGTQLAITSNGRNSGAWWVDLEGFEACPTP